MAKPISTFFVSAVCLGAAMLISGCIEHRVKTEPIHITVDVNVRVDKQLEEFFDFEEEYEDSGQSGTRK